MNIRSACNSALWSSILFQLRYKQCPKNLFNIIKSYLSDRDVILKFGNIKRIRKLNQSTPQGSSLGPGLWNILFDQIFDLQFSVNVYLICYCDYAIILISGNTCQELENIANQTQYFAKIE